MQGNDYEDMKTIVLMARIGQEIDARTAAAMLSRVDKAEAAQRPCPGYAAMLDDIKVASC
jgi:hypothetical protein